MNAAVGNVTDLIFGRWKSQILHAGAALGVFDQLKRDTFQSAADISARLRVDAALLARLMRALASLELVAEADGGYALTDSGALLTADAVGSLRAMALLEEGPEHYAIWAHLVTMIKDGKQNAFLRHYGQMAFDYAQANVDYGSTFRHAMSSFSAVQSQLALEAMNGVDFSRTHTVCDVAGGQGHLMCSLLQRQSNLAGIVLDLPEVVAAKDELLASRLGLANRCTYVAGDMFEDTPVADAYLLKMILHDWNDDECGKILSNIRRRVRPGGRVFIIEHIVPADGQPHFSKLYDIHMMCWGSGRERTEREYANLLVNAGWKFQAAHYPATRMMGVVEATAV